MTVLGTGIVVWSSCILFGLVDGLQHSLKVSGDPLDLIIIRKGATNETNGGFDLDKAEAIATIPGIAHDRDGKLLCALELLNIPVVPRIDGTRANVIVRGVSEASRGLRPRFELKQGRYLDPGKDECIVSQSISRRFQGASIGGLLRTGEREAYRVVGIFTAGGTAADSEVWVDRKDLERHTAREGSVSCVQLRAASADDFRSIIARIENDAQFRLQAVPETTYFLEQSRSSLFLKVTGTIIAVFLTVGAMFAAANTMFAAVNSRIREIGTMRAIGFSRIDILVSFLFESILICLIGGLIGVVATLPLSALTFGTNNFNTFTELTVSFRFGPAVTLVATAMTAAMGILGGLFPAIRAVRLDVVKALREL